MFEMHYLVKIFKNLQALVVFRLQNLFTFDIGDFMLRDLTKLWFSNCL